MIGAAVTSTKRKRIWRGQPAGTAKHNRQAEERRQLEEVRERCHWRDHEHDRDPDNRWTTFSRMISKNHTVDGPRAAVPRSLPDRTGTLRNGGADQEQNWRICA
jgi:hypothetical protein